MDTTLHEIERSGRRGVPNYAMEFRRKIGTLASQPGISVSKLAREYGLNANLVFSWRKRYGSQPEAVNFVPAVIEEKPAVPEPQRRPKPSSMELELNGVKIRFTGDVDAEVLRTVIAALR